MASKANNRNGKAKQNEMSFFCRVQEGFRIVARRASAILGSAWAFMAALAIIVIWGLSGHIFHYSDTWQLIINTGTTIVTFLMVFLIQNTQNRDSKTTQLKLDELIRSLDSARNRLMDLDTLSDEDLDRIKKQFERIGRRAEETVGKVGGASQKSVSS